MRRLAATAMMLLVFVPLARAGDAIDAAPFGLRFGMQADELAFEQIKGLEDRVVTDWGGANSRQDVIVRNPVIAQCGLAFDAVIYNGLINEDWVGYASFRKPAVENFNTEVVFTKAEADANDEERRATLFERVDPVIQTYEPYDGITNTRDWKRAHDRQVKSVEAFTGKDPLLDVIIEAPEDRDVYLGSEMWREKVVAAALFRQRRLGAYQLDVGGRKRRVCLVFAATGLMAVYIPQTELADAWGDMIDRLTKDSRYRSYRGEVADGEFDTAHERTLVHKAWVDDTRGLAWIAYAEGLKKKGWLSSKDRYDLRPKTTPYIMVISLPRRDAALAAFKADARAALDAETNRRGEEKATKDAAESAAAAAAKAARGIMLESLP